jgi:uncharacterized membrane protein YdjX (TVP38/TMEM64 family)
MEQNNKKIPLASVLFITVFILTTLALCLLFWPFVKKLGDPFYRERFRAWIENRGLGGVLLLFGIQVCQILIAVIPGEPVEIIAGAAYGALKGLALCLGGCVLASSLIFTLVKKFGLPLVNFFFHREKLQKYRFLQDRKKNALVVFILFLIPGTPKDMLTYIAPLGSLNAPAFIAISAFARIPSILTSTIIGDSVVKGHWVIFVLIFLLTALAGILGIVFTERIVTSIKKGEKDEESPYHRGIRLFRRGRNSG